MAKLRLSGCTLRIETGRHEGLPRIGKDIVIGAKDYEGFCGAKR
jgi:hypothetical protein